MVTTLRPINIEVLEAPFEDPDIWTITNFHHKLVNYACQLLVDSYGIRPPDGIRTEYYVKVKRNEFWIEKYLVDVAAIRQGKPYIAVECGGCSPEKLEDLATIFEKVIHIPRGVRTLAGDGYRLQVREQHAQELMARYNARIHRRSLWCYG